MYNTDIIKINNLLEAFFDVVNSYLTGGDFELQVMYFPEIYFNGTNGIYLFCLSAAAERCNNKVFKL
jgi:hypothetical protein